MSPLLDAVTLAGRRAPSRVVFGPHETNLARGRAIGDRHVAYYRARARGGAGVLVCETASVDPSDWPYERAPLATECEAGWRAVVGACRPHGSLVLAGLGHAGAQGSSAYSQSALWAPSPVADVASREMPMTMGDHELEALVDGFGAAAARAAAAGVDGVEIDIGEQSLLRQFHSGLTNLRHDAYGTDRLALTRRVLAAVRGAVGDDRVVAVRLSCDELAPWAGVTPEEAAGHVAGLAPLVDLITVVRGGPFSVDAYRPGSHEPPGFNRDLCRSMRDAAGGRAAVALQGSVVEAAMADEAVAEGTADLVEMTRALIADPALVAKVRAGEGSRVRPCILCNQACRVRDPRNPLVSCVGNPRAGYETAEPDTDDDTDAGGDGNGGGGGAGTGRRVLVVGAGPAGLECARVLAGRGHHVRVAEHGQVAGGALRASAVGPGRGRLSLLADWLERECRRAGVAFAFGSPVGPGELDRAADDDEVVVLATGSRPRPVGYPVRGAVVVDIVEALAGSPDEMAPGGVLVDDPVGGPVGVAAALWLAGAGRDVALVSPDPVAATLLSLAGDLAGANTRLQRAGVTRELRSRIREVADGRAELVDVWTGAARSVPCAVLVSCGARLPEESLYLTRPGTRRIGDCVAPRSVLESVLEGRRMATAIDAGDRGNAARRRPVAV